MSVLILDEECRKCDGFGWISVPGDTCRDCDGKGREPTALGSDILKFLDRHRPCPAPAQEGSNADS